MNLLPLSKSTYQDFNRCPQYAYNRKIKKIQPPVGVAALKGVQYHKIISDIIKGASIRESLKKATYPEVSDWLNLTLVNRPIRKKFMNADSEAKVLATRNLDVVYSQEEADLIGIMDVIWFDPNSKCMHILDFKTGRYENDNEIERHMYAALGKALQPAAKTIIFELYFVQSNRSLMSAYSWSSGDKVMVVRAPNNEITISREDINPLILWANNVLEEVEENDGTPKPGAHCKNWFGAECFYLQEHCPAYKNGRKIKNA